MVARVGINGFGRIGRVIFRTCMQSKDLEVTAINDPAIDIEYICYLIKFDSTHGKFKGAVTFSNNEISIDDKKIKVFCQKLPPDVPWQSADVQYVVEASGMFTNYEKASGHLASASVKRVIVTAPTVDVPMLILGVNKGQIHADQKVISCASSTLYCLAPIVKILEDNFGVAEGFITSIHAMTPSLKPLDGLCIRGKHWRDHRSIHQNIIPAATGACKALGKIIPSVKDKLTGLAFRVPIVNVSVLDISVRLTNNTTIQDIIKCVETQSKTTMKNIIKISKDQEVSSDFLGDENSCIFDVNSSLQLNPKFFKLICWYENEYSYACRVVGAIKYFEENHYQFKLMTKNPISFNHIISPKQAVFIKPLPDFKKEYVISNFHTQKCPKVLLSTCKEIGFEAKSPQRHVATERPHRSSGSNILALHQTKQNTEIFKVWNDDVEISTPLIKENRNMFFQSCMTLGPSYNMQSDNYLDTKERLEEVKKECSKMVDMTENLLKTSNQPNQNRSEKGIENVGGKNERKQEFNNTRRKLPILATSNRTSTAIHTNISKMYKDEFKTHQNENSNILMAINTRELNETSNVEFQEPNYRIETKCNPKIPDKPLSYRQCQPDSKVPVKNKEKVNSTKENDVLVNEQIISFENTICYPKKSCATTTVCNNNIKLNSIDHKADQGSFNLGNKLSSHVIQDGEIKKLKNNSDVLINSTNVNFKNIDSDLNSAELTVTYIKPEASEPETNRIIDNNEMRKKIIEEILNILNANTSEDKTRSPSLVGTNTTISAREVNKNVDIYDKIDSESATDSENSFQINERTSQIIDITDLTSSVEDLARMDKICRIIEISDEMSNKLFSALDNEDKKQKKWSFKDLCERLKLDDFCDNMFGQSHS